MRKAVLMTILLLPQLFFLGCGSGTPTSASSVSILKYPTADSSVFTSQLSIIVGGEEVTIDGPWFQSTFAGYNDTDLNLLIVALDVRCTDSRGVESSWSPVLEDDFVGIAAAAPNSNLLWTPTSNGTSINGKQGYTIYVGELPASGTSLRYRCEASFEGWFYGAEDDPETPVDETTLPGENFKKVVKFTARYQN